MDVTWAQGIITALIGMLTLYMRRCVNQHKEEWKRWSDAFNKIDDEMKELRDKTEKHEVSQAVHESKLEEIRRQVDEIKMQGVASTSQIMTRLEQIARMVEHHAK